MPKEIEVAYWYDTADRERLQEFNNPSKITVANSGALIFEQDCLMVLVIAPGDWHELTIEWKASDE